MPSNTRLWAWLAGAGALACALAATTLAWRGQLASATATPAQTEASVCALPAGTGMAAAPGMVWVPGGRFTMGDSVYPEERPAGPTRVNGFWMDRTEVTNDQFAEFVEATGYITTAERRLDAARHPGMPAELLQPGALVFSPPASLPARADANDWWRYVPGAHWRQPGGPGTSITGRGGFPVVAVSHQDAQAYARWKGRQLPSEAQWEWAARAARDEAMPSHEQPAQANTWQGPFPLRNAREDGFAGLAPVGCFAPNALGLFDMIGNVWELTRDVYTARHGDQPAPGQPLRHSGGSARVIKGGSFLCSADYCMRYRAGARQPQDDDLGTSHVGFRTVLEAPGPERQP